MCVAVGATCEGGVGVGMGEWMEVAVGVVECAVAVDVVASGGRGVPTGVARPVGVEVAVLVTLAVGV